MTRLLVPIPLALVPSSAIAETLSQAVLKLTDSRIRFNTSYSSLSHARKRGENDLQADNGLRSRFQPLLAQDDNSNFTT